MEALGVFSGSVSDELTVPVCSPSSFSMSSSAGSRDSSEMDGGRLDGLATSVSSSRLGARGLRGADVEEVEGGVTLEVEEELELAWGLEIFPLERLRDLSREA